MYRPWPAAASSVVSCSGPVAADSPGSSSPPPQAVTWQKTTEPETTTAPEPQRSWSVRTWTSTRVRTFHNGRGGTRWDRGAGRGGGGAGRGGRDQDQPHQCRRLRVQGAQVRQGPCLSVRVVVGTLLSDEPKYLSI